jgi:hypothetical protein
MAINGASSIALLPVSLELACELTRNPDGSSAMAWFSCVNAIIKSSICQPLIDFLQRKPFHRYFHIMSVLFRSHRSLLTDFFRRGSSPCTPHRRSTSKHAKKCYFQWRIHLGLVMLCSTDPRETSQEGARRRESTSTEYYGTPGFVNRCIDVISYSTYVRIQCSGHNASSITFDEQPGRTEL